MKKTHKSNGSKCTKTEYLEIEIFKHFLESFTYIIWKNKSVLDFVTEDEIDNLYKYEKASRQYWENVEVRFYGNRS